MSGVPRLSSPVLTISMKVMDAAPWRPRPKLAFWNDPRRWDGIDDPRAEMFWMRRRPDVIDVEK